MNYDCCVATTTLALAVYMHGRNHALTTIACKTSDNSEYEMIAN